MIHLPRWRILPGVFGLSIALVALDCRPIANVAPAAHPGVASDPQEIDYFGAEYVDRPGMQALLLKANHHGSCNGVTDRYLDMVQPQVVIMSLAAQNSYGFAQLQALELFRARSIRWYRTDVNGTITIRAGTGIQRGFEVSAERGEASTAGRGDQRSVQPICRSM